MSQDTDTANPPTTTSINEILEEGTCQKCGGTNPVWVAPNELWNEVIQDKFAFVCPTCFIDYAEAQGISPTAWLVQPEEIKKAPKGVSRRDMHTNRSLSDDSIARKHRVSDLVATNDSPITSLSNPQKHALYTLIASVRPKDKSDNPVDYELGVGFDASDVSAPIENHGYNRALQDYDNAIKEVLGESTN